MPPGFRLLAVSCLFGGTAVAAEYGDVVRQTPQLLAYYRCEAVGDVVGDESGRNHPATWAGPKGESVEGVTSALGRALRLVGGAHLRVPALGQYDAVTVEMWLRLRKPPAEGIAGLYAADRWQPGGFHYNLFAPGQIELAVNGIGRFPRTDPEAVPLDRWTHLVTTYDRESGEHRLYRDGRLLLDEIAAPALPLKLIEASIGAWINDKPTRPLEADVDEIAIYAAALTPGQIRQHYQLARGISATPVDFAATIRPLLAERCLGCHGPEKQESELRLDVRDSALRGGESGEPAIAPFAADQSHLLQLVTSSDRESRMPPEGEPLTPPQIALLRDWIDQGAVWPNEFAGHLVEEPVTTSHWSFQPIGRPT
ncbi:MAG: c-type cytochrome domain-containing protein, partial [Planctomycetaceae bacterium]|nr:c-type cytochrome domain-containing protein [Planctomycetaceae bacterium]